MVRANLDGVPDAQSFRPIPPGQYMMEVEGITEKVSSAGNTLWNVALVMVGGEYAGLHVWDNLTWSEKAYQRVRNFLLAIDALQEGEAEYDPQRFVGKRVMVDVTQETYEGKVRNKVAFAGYEPAENKPAKWQSEPEPGPPADLIDEPPF